MHTVLHPEILIVFRQSRPVFITSSLGRSGVETNTKGLPQLLVAQTMGRLDIGLCLTAGISEISNTATVRVPIQYTVEKQETSN